MSLKARNFEGYETIVAELHLKAAVSHDPDHFCSTVVKMLKDIIDIETLILFKVADDLNLENVASHGRPYTVLETGKFLKSHRKTPITETIRSQKYVAIGNTRKILLEFPDLIEWPRIMPSVVGIPVTIDGITVAGCSYVLADEFSLDDRDLIVKILEEITTMIFSVYQRSAAHPD